MIHPVSCGLIYESKYIPDFILNQSTLQTKGAQRCTEINLYFVNLLLIPACSRQVCLRGKKNFS